MARANSITAQALFDLRERARLAASSENRATRALGKLVGGVVGPTLARVGVRKLVVAKAYGRDLLMPAEHFLPSILAAHPLFDRPLARAVKVLLNGAKPTSIIDVGANIGDTIAAIEEANPGRCVYLAIEPDPRIFDLCRHNHADNSRVSVIQACIGEREGLSVSLMDDGRSNPAVDLNATGTAKLVRLDTLCREFADKNGVDLIKIDTEGYDFTVIRSAASLIDQYRPGLYFEWYPRVLSNVGEDPVSIFSFLAKLGYLYCALFTARGYFYCELSNPDSRSVEVLCRAASASPDIVYFDVFCFPDCNVVRRLSDSYTLDPR